MNKWKRFAKLRLKAAQIREELAQLSKELENDAPPKEVSFKGISVKFKRSVSYYVPAKRVEDIKHTLPKKKFHAAFATQYRFRASALRDPEIESIVQPEKRVQITTTFYTEE